MEKTRYGVSIVNREIMPSEEASPFVIEATEEEIGRLQELFQKLETKDNLSIGFAANLAVELEHNDREAKNTPYYQTLKEIYRFVYVHGVPETKIYIENRSLVSLTSP